MLSPKQVVATQFGTKDQLASEVAGLFDDIGAEMDKEEKDGLVHVSSKKLLRLHTVASGVKAKFQNCDNLVAEILKAKSPGSKVDEDYKRKLETRSVKQLWDLYSTIS